MVISKRRLHDFKRIGGTKQDVAVAKQVYDMKLKSNLQQRKVLKEHSENLIKIKRRVADKQGSPSLRCGTPGKLEVILPKNHPSAARP